MPFERYLSEGGPYQTYDYNQASGSSSRPSDVLPDTSTHSGYAHSVRLQIPQFMQTGAPMLAPGGGAEILPAGLLTGSSDGCSSWFANNGLMNAFSPDSPSFLEGSSRIWSPSPITHHNQNQTRRPEDSPIMSSASSTSSTNFAPPAGAPPTGAPSSEPKPSSPNTLSMYINSGLINPRFPISPNQLNAIGAAVAGSVGLNAPSPLGLPVYSASGFDLLSVLARVATRPDPKVALGPVDLTSSFLVVDVRRYDHPIVYCSPTFCRLTGYEEHEVLGKNCRFLQSPDGIQPKGETRKFTSHEAVKHMKKCLVADKECQTSIINYRKSGEAFINLVTVIPIRGGEIGAALEDDQVVYHVGFQVDLNEQPNVILEKLKDGSYIVNYAANDPVSIIPSTTGINGGPGGAMLSSVSRDRKTHIIPTPVMSKDLKKMMEDPSFVAQLKLTTCTNVDATSPSSTTTSSAIVAASSLDNLSDLVNLNGTANHALSMVLLEYAPDFIHVVSLKGTFLYVAPAVRRVLGYEPTELVGKSLSDICHPADVVPLMRELKESSATGSTALGSTIGTGVNGEDYSRQYQPIKPRSVDLLFRAQNKAGTYVWVECRGRLHVEPGKGRKAILLSGRAKEMSILQWSAIASAGGLSKPRLVSRLPKGDKDTSLPAVEVCTEFWGTLTRTGTLLVIGPGVKDVLGWDDSQLIGRQIWGYVADEDARRCVGEELAKMGCVMGSSDSAGSLPRKIFCRMLRPDRSVAEVELVLYPSSIDMSVLRSTQTISPAPIIYQIKSYNAFASPGSQGSSPITHSLEENVFKELETGRGSSWQYELQQLKFANERMKEEIKALEGEQESREVVSKRQRPQSVSPVVASLANSSSLQAQSPQLYQHINHSPTAVASGSMPPWRGYDHQAHQPDIGHSYPVSNHSSLNTGQNAHSHSLYSASPFPQQQQTWSTGSPTNQILNIPTSVSMPMSFFPPAPQSGGVRYNQSAGPNPSPSLSLKRTWDAVDRNDPT